MKKFLLIACILFLSACGNNGYYETAYVTIEHTEPNTTILVTTAPPATTVLPTIPPQAVHYRVEGPRNFVDIRYELVSLIFRLAGSQEFGCMNTDYQRSLAEEFNVFRNHPAINYARRLRWSHGVGFDAVFSMAIHLERYENGFALKDNIDMLVVQHGGFARWTAERAALFVEYLNDFYTYTNFADFFDAHLEYYMEHSLRFYEAVYSQVNFEWFRQHGLSPYHMRVMLTPSMNMGGFGPSRFCNVAGLLVAYAGMPAAELYIDWYHQFLVHEFSHSFANPIAYVWYEENEDFRRWSRDTVDTQRMPHYPTGRIIAGEYVTRAFEILYMIENRDGNLLHLLLQQVAHGFPYIEHVFAMITDHEIMLEGLTIGSILGVQYVKGEEYYFEFPDGRIVTWRFLDLLGYELDVDNFLFANIGNVIPSQTGDVIYHSWGGDTSYLMIDIGCALALGWGEGFRMYAMFRLG